MKVAIEARALSNQGGGVNRYVRNLLTSLLKKGEELSCYPIIDRYSRVGLSASHPIIVKRYGDIGLSWWLNYQVEKRLRGMDIDVMHYTKADVPRKKRRPTVVTIYDVIPLLLPKGQKLSRRWYWPQALRRAAENSDHIITISEASKKDISERLQVNPDKITVTKLSVEDGLITNLNQPAAENPYILFVGTIEPRKNVGGLLRAFAKIHNQIPQRLIIVGKPYKGGREWLRLANQLGIADKVEWKGYVKDVTLRQIYEQAQLFVWPSVYEGWGFPAQEAMACGVPVIVSNGGALPEVVGDAGEIVNFGTENVADRIKDQEFIDQLGERMLSVLGNPTRQAQMRERGRKRARLYNWDMVATQTVDVYKKVME